MTDTGLITAVAMGIACAVLSVFVVMRRWAFIGEGVAHGGLGGAGTVWLLSLVVPSLNHPVAVYAGVAIFCIGMAVGIAYFTRSGRLSSDTVIGVFLVAAVAWGFVAQGIYVAQRNMFPIGFETILFGRMGELSWAFTAAALVGCAAVVATVVLLWKEILSYCFDPLMAEVSGVRSGAIHYLLIVLLTVAILIGTRVLGSILVIAMLVLPGATAMMLSRRLGRVMAISIAAGTVGVLVGIAAHAQRSYLPVGPSIALVLFIEFLVAYVVSRLPRTARLDTRGSRSYSARQAPQRGIS
jgi:ABC-type Mn2+/Zn2+ transport system permease subunit